MESTRQHYIKRIKLNLDGRERGGKKYNLFVTKGFFFIDQTNACCIPVNIQKKKFEKKKKNSLRPQLIKIYMILELLRCIIKQKS